MTAAVRLRLAEQKPGYPHTVGRTLAIYSGLMVTVLLAALDQTIVATALPSIVSSLGGLSSYAWMFSAFLICQTVTVPLYGRLGDVFGRRRLFFISIPIFLIGSGLCGIAQSMPELAVFRGLQGLGAGGVIPLAMATTADIVPPRDRGRYAALIATGFASASILGPTVGGLIVDHASWRWIFYVNLPIGAIALAVIARTMPKRTRRGTTGQRVDYPGAVLLAAATTALLLAMLWGGQTFAWGSVEVIGAAVAFLVLGAAFLRRTRRIPEPLVPLRVLHNGIVSTGSVATCLSVICQFGATTFVPLFAQGVLGKSATSSGLVLIPQTIGAVLATIAVGQWISRTGRYRGNALLGPVLIGLGMLQLAFLDTSASDLQIVGAMILVGVGSGLMMQSLMLASQSAVPFSAVGSATSMIQFSRAIGTTVGVALFGAIINFGLPHALHADGLVVRNLPVAYRHALAAAMHPAFFIGAGMCAVILVVLWRGLDERPLRASLHDTQPESVSVPSPLNGSPGGPSPQPRPMGDAFPSS